MSVASENKNGNGVLGKVKNYVIENPLLFIIFVIIIVVGILQPNFLTLYNLMNILRHAALLGILTVGMTFVIISGGIDLSVGSVMGLTSVVVAGLNVNNGLNIWIAVAIGLLIGIASGATAGILVSKVKVPPFLATLALLGILRGLDLVITDSQPINGMPASFLWIGRGMIFDVFPFSALLWLIFFAIAFIFQKYHTYGRYTYAIGGNYESAKYTGVKVDKLIIITYIISGFVASVSGILHTARLDSGQPMLGSFYELMAIAAVCAGGTSLMGGKGGVLGSLYGAILVSVLYNAMSLLGLSTFLQEIAVGILLIMAVTLSLTRTSRKARLA